MAFHPPLPAGDGLSEVAPPPDGRPLLTVQTYADAVRAVDALADAQFPVEHVAIVGRGVRTVERVSGRSGPALRPALLAGGLIGLFFGVLFDWWGAVTPTVPVGWLALYGLGYGVLMGLAVAVLFRRAGRARTVEADRYDLTLTGGERAGALQILHRAGLA